MATDEFAAGMFELETIATADRAPRSCAPRLLWWRCHRRLIADALTAVGYEVRHIRDANEPELHRLAPPASIIDGVLSYESPEKGRSSWGWNSARPLARSSPQAIPG